MLKVRFNKPEDRAYIASSMYKYLLARNDFKDIGKAFNAYFDKLMESHRVKVVYDTEAPDVIMAYCIYKEEEVLNVHFLYVRYSFRCCGIGTLLLDAVTCEHKVFYHLLSSPRIDGIKLETNSKEEAHKTRKLLISKAIQIKTPFLLTDFGAPTKPKSKNEPQKDS